MVLGGLEIIGMSNIKILIKGEEAEAFAEELAELLGIEGISRENNGEVAYKGKVGELIILVAAGLTISQGIVSHAKDIKNLYDYYHDRQKIEVKIRQEDGQLCDFQDFLSSSLIEPLSIDNLDESLPTLQEISKLPIPERHQLLSPFISGMAEDFRNDPELTIFSVLDGEGLQENGN